MTCQRGSSLKEGLPWAWAVLEGFLEEAVNKQGSESSESRVGVSRVKVEEGRGERRDCSKLREQQMLIKFLEV